MSEEMIETLEQAPSLIEEVFTQWDERLDRLEVYVETEPNLELYKFPEWWNDENSREVWNLPATIKDSEASPDIVYRYLETYGRSTVLTERITRREPDDPMVQVLYALGSDVVGQAMALEPTGGPLRAAVVDSLERAAVQSHGIIDSRVQALAVAYGVQTPTELLGIQDDEYGDRIRAAICQPNAIRRIRYLDEQKPAEGEDWSNLKTYQREWINKAIIAIGGVDADEANDYSFSVSRRWYDEGVINLLEKFSHFGIDRIRAIAEKTGIHGLEAYTVSELERMEAFTKNPKVVSEQLADHDVTVVMTNRVGDHNGVLEGVADMFDDSGERTLFFEIENLSDIYRYMIHLNKVGIRPSTLVLAAHSSPGQFAVSDDRPEHRNDRYTKDLAVVAARKLIAVANKSSDIDPGIVGYSMHGMKGMAKLVEELMRPSRGVDDNEIDIDRKKIIFQACHAASEINVGDLDDNGDKMVIGMESVISQLGKDLAASGVKTSVDIYGAEGGIQMHGNEKSVYYSSQPESMGQERGQLSANVVRVGDGHITTEKVSDIKLRR